MGRRAAIGYGYTDAGRSRRRMGHSRASSGTCPACRFLGPCARTLVAQCALRGPAASSTFQRPTRTSRPSARRRSSAQRTSCRQAPSISSTLGFVIGKVMSIGTTFCGSRLGAPCITSDSHCFTSGGQAAGSRASSVGVMPRDALARFLGPSGRFACHETQTRQCAGACADAFYDMLPADADGAWRGRRSECGSSGGPRTQWPGNDSACRRPPGKPLARRCEGRRGNGPQRRRMAATWCESSAIRR